MDFSAIPFTNFIFTTGSPISQWVQIKKDDISKISAESVEDITAIRSSISKSEHNVRIANK